MDEIFQKLVKKTKNPGCVLMTHFKKCCCRTCDDGCLCLKLRRDSVHRLTVDFMNLNQLSLNLTSTAANE